MTNPVFEPYSAVAHAHPIVHTLCKIANEQKMDRKVLSDRAGVSSDTMRLWWKGRRPRVDIIDACFQALGYTLTIEKNTPGY